MTFTPEQLHIIQHSLGCDKFGQAKNRGADEGDGRHGYYRNRYVSDPTPDLMALTESGFLKDYGAQSLMGGMHYFAVTREGVEAMIQQSPKPPKLTRGQKMYREFLSADCGMTFIEYLKWRHANRERIAALYT